MSTASMTLFHYRVTNPNRTGVTTHASAYFSSIGWLHRCLIAWSLKGDVFSVGPEEDELNAIAKPQTLFLARTPFLMESIIAYDEARVGRDGSPDGACHAMDQEVAGRLAHAYRLTVEQLCLSDAISLELRLSNLGAIR